MDSVVDINKFLNVLDMLRQKQITPTRLRVGDIEADLQYASAPPPPSISETKTKEEQDADVERSIFNL